MSSVDKYPTNIEYEIDRVALIRYWRLQATIGYSLAPAPIAGMFGLAFFRLYVETHPGIGGLTYVAFAAMLILAGLFAGMLVGILLYFLMSHFLIKLSVKNLRLLVEGPYLRSISGAIFVTDRRIHFRAISDYSTSDGPLLRRFGMRNLSFTVIGSTAHASTVVSGLKNPDEVRDQLCEIDAAREI